VGAEFFHAEGWIEGWSDSRQTDITQLTVAVRNFANSAYEMRFSYQSPANLQLATNVRSESQTLSWQFLHRQSCVKISVKCNGQSMFIFIEYGTRHYLVLNVHTKRILPKSLTQIYTNQRLIGSSTRRK